MELLLLRSDNMVRFFLYELTSFAWPQILAEPPLQLRTTYLWRPYCKTQKCAVSNTDEADIIPERGKLMFIHSV